MNQPQFLFQHRGLDVEMVCLFWESPNEDDVADSSFGAPSSLSHSVRLPEEMTLGFLVLERV